MLKAVYGPDGKVQLYDIFIRDKWYGSKRRFDWAYTELQRLLKEG